MKPVIIGQSPARGNEKLPPFSGRSGARLARLAGVGESGDVLPEHFELYNLLYHYPGKQGKGDGFDMKVAKRNGARLVHYLSTGPPRQVLLMGRKVRRAMGVNSGNWNYLEWFDFCGGRACVFPHPSGVNRWWNNKDNELRAASLLKDVIRNG